MTPLYGVLAASLSMATPLLLAALGENIVQCAGIVNVGIEGMMLVGAFAATLAALATSSAAAAIAAAAVAGSILALLFAWFSVGLRADQVVVGVVLNLLAAGVTGTIYRARFGAGGSFISTVALPRGPGGLTALTPIAVAAVPAAWWWLRRTRAGLRLRACGEEPDAADAAGVSVPLVRTMALVAGGVTAGMAGAYLSIGENSTFVPNMTNGRGFIALAVVTCGRWNPWGCLAAAAAFGLADAMQFQAQALGVAVPHDLLLGMPYVATVLILVAGGRSRLAPAALALPWRKS